MKIAMISEHASPLAALGGADAGGQNVHVAELSAALARRGHDVDVYTRRDDPDLPERVRTDQGYTVVHVPVGPPRQVPKDELLQFMVAFGRYLDAQWDRERPDIAHAHFWMSGIAAQLAAKRRRVPTIQTFHALGVVKQRHQGQRDTSPAERLRLETHVALEATWVTAGCSDEVFELMRLGRDRLRISVVPCGVDVDRFCPHGPIAARSGRRRIVVVGRFVPRKGIDTVIEALTTVPTAELVIAGGPERAELDTVPEACRLRQLAADLGVAERVSLLGSVAREDMPALLRSADVVACTPWYEPFGIVPLEAMACGVPVVASAVGGMLDTVVHDVTGLLIPPKDPRACANAINAILRDRRAASGFGKAGRERARSRYSWDRVATDTLRVYDRLVPAAAPGRGAARASGSG
ncbi:glycosyl transferase [Mycolicibacter heraklionensis]|uniref:Glycosyl transferase n=1 Tax=Mycolicibacter heraklionensis TaxID=512402 RepID=A0ABR5FH47_9MYCO|nr:glycosyltransferase [Mycolicibacter heraklionensis]KLO29668.1 glycosyl transferase [Mycolicibacter heraklionensis]